MSEGRLTFGQRLMAAGGLTLLALAFLPWLGGEIDRLVVQGRSFPVHGFEFSHNAWGYTLTSLACLVVLIALCLLGAKALGMRALESTRASTLVAVLGALCAALVVTKVVLGPDVTLGSFSLPRTADLGGVVHVSFRQTRHVAAWLGIIASMAFAAGGAVERFRHEV